MNTINVKFSFLTLSPISKLPISLVVFSRASAMVSFVVDVILHMQ
jgi:hypothetical protein